jgi:hypothetical protein
MALLPPFNWRVPLNTDRPGGGRQIRELAEDIAATVEAGTGRAHASTKRTTESVFTANTYGPVSGQVQIAAAPVGVYHVAWIARYVREGAVGTPITINVNVDGAVLFDDTVAEINDSYQRTMSGLIAVVKAAAGPLTAQVQIRGPLCAVKALPNSRIDVTRVSI